MKGLPFLVFLLVIVPVVLFSQTFLYAPKTVRQGEAFPVLFSCSDSEEKVTAQLAESAGTVLVSAEGFAIPYFEKTSIFAALFGVPSTVVPGEYRIFLSAGSEEGEDIPSREVIVTGREFLHEDIVLSVALSDLRRSEDPQKIEEALELRRLLTTCNHASFFHLSKHIKPVPESRETSSFGDRRRYIYADQEKASAIHNGIDLAAPIGTLVYASGSGKVVFAGERIVSGKTVVIEHLPGFYGLYYHLDTISVKVGDIISQGTSIGTVGMTGLATGPHLHWELRVSGVAVNPLTFLADPLIDKVTIIGIIGGTQ